METIFVPLALLAGGLLPIQAGANAQLSKSVASPFAATTLQLLVGAAVLLLITTLAGSLAALAGLSGVPWWHAIGGLASALYVVSGILLFPRLGAVVTVGLFIAGQMLASVALDTSGILGVAAQSFDIATAAGTGAVLLGIIAIVKGQTAGTNAQPVASLPGWVLLAFVAGAILPIQGAVNALLRADLDAPLAVGAVSFVVATAGMALVFSLTAIATENAQTSDARPAEHALVGLARRLRRRLLRRDCVHGHSGNRHCRYSGAHDRRATIGLDARGSIRPLAPAATAHFGTALDGRGAAPWWSHPHPDVVRTRGVGMP